MVASTLSSTTLPCNAKNEMLQQNGVSTNGGVANVILPKDRYTLVGIDVDTTGRRLIDEIVQLAAFTPQDHFEQYIMPYMNLNPAARKRHQVRVISAGFYRMLKSTQTFQIIKSKSEICALKDFLDWLEALKAKDANSQGIILLYHEDRKFIPYMVLKSLKKYNLLDRFMKTVKSFTNGLNLAKASGDKSLQPYTLRELSKHLKASNNNVINQNIMEASSTTAVSCTEKISPSSEQQKNLKSSPNRKPNLFDGNARVRAKLAYEVAFHLSNHISQESISPSNTFEKMLAALHPYTQPIECDLNELQSQNKNFERQISFRRVFLNYFKTTLYHRVRAVKFRIILAEHGYDLQTLNGIWSEKKREGLVEILQVIDQLTSTDKTELADLFDSYFDPAKKTIRPVVKTNSNHRRHKLQKNVRKDINTVSFVGNEQEAGGDKVHAGNNTANLPDSTTKSPKNQHMKHQPRASHNKNSLKMNNTVASTPTTSEDKINSAITTPAIVASN